MIIRIREFYMALKFSLKGLKKNPFKVAKFLNRSQFWDRNKMEKFQLNSLNEILIRAKNDVKYYQTDLYKNISSFDSLKEFRSKSPILVKNEIKRNEMNFIANRKAKSFKHQTSGSTGMPMAFEISHEAESFRFANNLRFYAWHGLSMFDKNVLIWRINVPVNGLSGLFKKYESKFLGRLILNVFDINDETIHYYYRKINRFKPKYLRGYKSGIYELAVLMDKNNLKFRNSKLKLVVVTSETLTSFEREFMQNVFECKVANEYGGAEAGLYAAECPDGSLHINEESVLLYCDIQNNVYTTELFNYSTPLINYKNEDRVVLSDEKCSCGINLKLIKDIQGRISDLIICPDGKKIHSYIIAVIMSKVQISFKDGLRQFKCTQIRNLLRIEIVPGPNFRDEVLEEIEKGIKNEISDKFSIQIVVVDDIKRDKSGKRGFFRRQE